MKDTERGFVCRTRVRYGETDKMGIAYYGRYVDWFEMGRTEFCRASGKSYTEWEAEGILLPVVEAQKDLCIDRLAALSRYCGCADETAEPAQAADRFLEALQKLLTDCGLELGCAAIQEADTEKLIRMVDADSINYSPPKTFRDEELKEILDHIRRGA